MRILVTGGAGYVGSHVTRALQEAGHEPVVYDNLSTGHAQAVSDCELHIGDLLDGDGFRRFLKRHQFDGAVHLAAVSLVGESMRKPSDYFTNNVGGGLALFDGLVSADIPWVVLSSTAAVYGEPETVPIDEEHPKMPTNPYGDSKWMLERILGWYGKAYGLRSAALRYFNAAGAHPRGDIGEDHQPETHLIPIILQVALGKRAALDVYGSDYETPDGTAVRDYVHVCDLARAHLGVMECLHQGAPSCAYNLGSQSGYSVQEVVEAVRTVTGKTVETNQCPRRPGDPPVLIACAEQAKQGLNWAPEFDLRTIVETAWRWHVGHPTGYR